MTTQYTSLLGLALPVTGELSGSWGTTVNTAITSLLDNAVAGTTSITVDADITLTTTTGAANEARQAIILWNPASGTTTRNITAPAQSKIYTVINASGGTQSIVFRGAGPTTGVTIVKGESAVVAWDGSDFIKVSTSNADGSGDFTALSASGSVTLSGGTANGVAYLNGSKVLTTGTALQFNGTSIGLGTTPTSGWASGYTVIESSDVAGLVSSSAAALYSNTYISSTGPRAIGTGYPAAISVNSTDGSFIYGADSVSRIPGVAVSLNAQFSVSRLGVVTAPTIYTETVTSARPVSVNSSGVLGYISSTRASKTNIEAIDDVQWLMALDPVKFNYRKRDGEQNYTAEFDEEVEYGLIAEDAEQVNADIVFHDIVEGQKELRGVHYNKLIAPLLKLAQEQQAKITALTARVEALESN
jgi:hypothetical protein